MQGYGRGLYGVEAIGSGSVLGGRIGLFTATSRVELWLPRMMHGSEVTVTSDPRRKIDELASELDDLATTAEELEIEATNEADAAELKRLQRALEEASDAADVVDDNMDDEDA